MWDPLIQVKTIAPICRSMCVRAQPWRNESVGPWCERIVQNLEVTWNLAIRANPDASQIQMIVTQFIQVTDVVEVRVDDASVVFARGHENCRPSPKEKVMAIAWMQT
jgi:hypothetical protein